MDVYNAIFVKMEASPFLVAAAVIILIFLWTYSKSNGRKSLPGPTGLPIIGYLPFMTSKPYKKFQELSKTYGPLYKVQLGRRDIVMICDYKIFKEAFMEDAFIGRPSDLPFELSETTIRTGAFLGLAWKEQRRFSLHALRDLGFGKTKMEEHIKEEILEVIERLEKQKEFVKMSNILAPSASNNIASFLFGKRLKYNDPRRQKMDKFMSEIGLFAGTTAWQFFFPGIRAFMRYFNIGNGAKLSKALQNVRDYCIEEMKEHEASLDPNNIRDFMDRYLLEIRKKEGDKNSGFQKDVLLDVARGFFAAGSETVRVTVDWMLLVAAAFPDVQSKIHGEIDEVLGRERFPSWQDHLAMPYTEAAITEVMRWKTIVPLNIMRYTLEDTELKGYFIPKHSYVISVLYCPDHDESLWGKDVEEYKPERFLSEDGKKVVKPEYYNPFSVGKRSCPGKSLAEIEVFLYVVAILQKFKLSMPPGKQANLEPVLGISLMPERQDIRLELR